jgi:hypothetical protein
MRAHQRGTWSTVKPFLAEIAGWTTSFITLYHCNNGMRSVSRDSPGEIQHASTVSSITSQMA